ncbi:MAG: tyrosine-type recombinase/integrase [Clostridia bacterium]|nr:tyrosine-type recombinase/integrase [Clostridia bacterium]
MSDVPNEKSISPPQESTKLADSQAEGKIPASVSDGAYKNLVSQLNSILKHSNERSIKSRHRYYEAAKRFCRFLADNYRLQKFKNVEERHFRAYAEYLKENNAATTIQTDLSGIRYFHEKSGSKNKLSKNDHLDLPKRAVGKENRAWTPEEISKARAVAREMGRVDVEISLDLVPAFGLRIEELCRLKVEYLMHAKADGQLIVQGKGKKTRPIPVDENQMKIIKKYLDYAKASGRYPSDYLISSSEKNGVLHEKRSLQNWVSFHREKFMDENRADMKEEGKKDRHETISWHGLRHNYAQRRFEEVSKVSPEKAKKVVSHDLGHGREEITDIYLPFLMTKTQK